MKGFVEELESLKTGLWGYDREAVLAYLRELIGRMDDEKAQAIKEISDQKDALAAENAALRGEVKTRKQLYDELAKRVDQMSTSMDTSLNRLEGYSKESAKTLEGYCRREQELAAKEAKTEEKCAEMLRQADAKAVAIVKAAETKAEHIRSLAMEAKGRILADTRDESETMIAEAEQKVRKQKELYDYYCKSMRSYCQHVLTLLETSANAEAVAALETGAETKQI